MKSIFVFYFFVSVAISATNAQEWVKDWVAKNSIMMLKPDSMITLLTHDFQKAISTPAPTFSFKRLDDDKFQNLKDFRGNVVLVSFWATNCSGCRYEMPDLSHLQDSLSAKGLQVIFLSSESKDLLIRYFTDNKISGIKGILKPNQLKQPYQMFAYPSSFVVDRNGIVRDTWLGPLKFDILVKRVLPYLATNNK